MKDSLGFHYDKRKVYVTVQCIVQDNRQNAITIQLLTSCWSLPKNELYDENF